MTAIRMVTGKHHSQTTCDDQLIDLFVCSLQLMVFLEWPRLSPRFKCHSSFPFRFG